MNDEDYKRILVRAPNWLGDVVMITPCVRALRDRFPRAHIAVVVRAAFADVLANSDAVDEIIAYKSDRGLRSVFAMRKRLKAGNYDLAIVFPRSFRSALPPFLARIPRRIGYRTEMRGPLLTDPIARDEKFLRMHRVHYYANLLRPLGIDAVPDRTEIHPTQDDRDRARRFAAAGEGPLVALHCGATYGTAKQWPRERFAELAKGLREKYSARIVLIGGPSERETAEFIAARADCNCAISAGETTVLQLAALLQICDLLVTNDTGPMHVADAAGTPIVAIFGPTDPVTTSPYGPSGRVVGVGAECAPCLLRACPRDHRCMLGVAVQSVLDEAGRILAEGGR